MTREQRYHSARRWVLALLAGAAAWRRWGPFVVAVDGQSMAPALLPGDFVVALRRGRVRRGAVVVVALPGRPGFELVKRITAGPGQRVGERVLGSGQWWVEGDRPGASTDSRSFGPVPAGSVRGVVVVRYWPPSRAGRIR